MGSPGGFREHSQVVIVDQDKKSVEGQEADGTSCRTAGVGVSVGVSVHGCEYEPKDWV